MDTTLNTVQLPSPADKIVADFVDRISAAVPELIEGIYLTGSISMGDFYPGKSDIDFLVFCKTLPDNNTAVQLKRIHRAIQRRYPHPPLNGSYIASDGIRAINPAAIQALTYHNGRLRDGVFAMAPVSLSELKLNAVTILGQNAKTIHVDINPDFLNNFLYDNINSYWKLWLARHSSYFRRKLFLLLFPRFSEWAVLGVARQVCTLQTGRIVSKTEAGLYCLQQLPEKYHAILHEALEIRKDDRRYPLVKSHAVRPSFRRMRQTLDCIGYMIIAFNDSFNKRYR